MLALFLFLLNIDSFEYSPFESIQLENFVPVNELINKKKSAQDIIQSTKMGKIIVHVHYKYKNGDEYLLLNEILKRTF